MQCVRSFNGWVPVTESRMQHWQWLMTLMDDRNVAERFLAAVPAYVRDAAMTNAARTVDEELAGLADLG